MSPGLSLYIATYYGSLIPNALLLIVIQKSEGSLVSFEV
nr:MAG TPA: hypothetical protein [Caudoviricetes sp.]